MDDETVEKVASFLRKHGPLIVALLVAMTPGIWFVIDFIYKARIEAIREQVVLCQQRLDFADTKLRSDGPLPSMLSGTGGHAGAAPTTQVLTRGHYPHLENQDSPTLNDVRLLAEYYELLKEWPPNGHLRFKSGDLSYWKEQGLSSAALDREFESRRLVLVRAQQIGTSIRSQGDLSHAAESLQDQMMGADRTRSP